MEVPATPHIQKYFQSIDNQIALSYKVAEAAKQKGYDPEPKVEIPLVFNMAQRVEGLVSVVAPQIIGSGVSERIMELEEEFGALHWRVSLTIAHEIALEKFCKFKDKIEAMEIGIRAGFAYHTMGVVASPLEGFVCIKIKKRRDGKEYFAINYAGPIRSAGGTGASVSVLIVDYIRKMMGYAPYDPDEREIKRLSTELYDYHERITNLQYLPSVEEIEFLAKHLPVQIDGDGSEKIEVSNYKDLDRVETNKIRNGVCLVIGEGLAQKAKKVWKQLSQWGHNQGLEHWDFMGEFCDLQKKIKAKGKVESDSGTKEKAKVTPDYTFIKDMVAGRPVFTHPLHDGGFRLRFGRARTSGFSSACIHPATMTILNKYLGTGTQLKVERPGKGATVTACDTIDGPIVKLEDGSVMQIGSIEEAKSLTSRVTDILYLGDMLINYGDFFNRAHLLVPPGYCPEWWVQEFEKAVVDRYGSIDADKISCAIQCDVDVILSVFSKPIVTKVGADLAFRISREFGVPLHPEFTFFWKTLPVDKLPGLLDWLATGNYVRNDSGDLTKIVLNNNIVHKPLLELLAVPHEVVNKEYVVIKGDYAKTISYLFRFPGSEALNHVLEMNDETNIFRILGAATGIIIRDKSGLFIGARMGRPEKAKQRMLAGSPHCLFPVGDEGGRLRCFQSAVESGKVVSDFPINFCSNCQRQTVLSVCPNCDSKTHKLFHCKTCGPIKDAECKAHGPARPYFRQSIDIKSIVDGVQKKLGMPVLPDLIKGVRGTSNKEHIPEHLGKGVLRAKHNVYVNKDGTTRYDMTQLPLTHFKPKEVRTSIDRLRELGYEYDTYGKPLENEDQVCELLPQDIVLPSCEGCPDEGADVVLFRVAKFIDDMLVNLYGLEPFYRLKSPIDLVGNLCLCLAPHTSAGITVRIVGFSKTQGLFAHPLIHAATRRDCDGDEACVTLLLDVLINFSRHFLPAHRGSTQDAPLVLTSRLIPGEVDDMVFDMDVAWKYPLEFYEACCGYKNPWDVKLDQISSRLGTERQYCGMGFTHDIGDMNYTILCSAYKTLPSMGDKLLGQMDIAQKVRAVETSDVAKLVIEKHFLKDTKGNLRKFSQQQFRCVKCNEKFRRPPLIGKCTKCGGKLLFTISEGSVVKYLRPSIDLAQKYCLPNYLRQTLDILQRRIDGVFGKEKEKQEGLNKWF